MRFRISVLGLLVLQLVIAISCYLIQPFRPTITITPKKFVDTNQKGNRDFKVVSSIHNDGHSSVYIHWTGETSSDISLWEGCPWPGHGFEQDTVWVPILEPRHIDIRNQVPTIGYLEIRPGQSKEITTTHLAINYKDICRLTVELCDWRGRVARVSSERFDLNAIPIQQELNEAEQ